MAITKLKSQYLTFTQPQIGSTVNVRIDGAIDWIFVGGQAFIHNAGLYNVLSKSGQIFELELVIPLKQPETVIHRGFIAPVLYSSDGIPQTEETLYLVNEYEFLGLDDEDTQADFNQKILRATRIEKRISESVSGSKNISLSYPAGHYDLTMTGATTLAFTDMIEEDETTVISLTVTGNYALTMPGFLEKSESSDDYEGTMINEIVINIKKGGINPEGYYTISNYEI